MKNTIGATPGIKNGQLW